MTSVFKTLLPFSFLPVSLRIEEYQRKGETEKEWGPAEPSQTQSPSMSAVSCCQNRFSLLGLPESRAKQLLIREVMGCRNKGKAVQQEKK